MCVVSVPCPVAGLGALGETFTCGSVSCFALSGAGMHPGCVNYVCSCSTSKTTCSKPGRWKWETVPYLDLLRGVRERQCVDATGGQSWFECFRAISEDDLFFLSNEGVLGCFLKIGKLLKGVREKIKVRYFEMHSFAKFYHIWILTISKREMLVFWPFKSYSFSLFRVNSQRLLPIIHTSFFFSSTICNASASHSALINYYFKKKLPSWVESDKVITEE